MNFSSLNIEHSSHNWKGIPWSLLTITFCHCGGPVNLWFIHFSFQLCNIRLSLKWKIVLLWQKHDCKIDNATQNRGEQGVKCTSLSKNFQSASLEKRYTNLYFSASIIILHEYLHSLEHII